MLNGDQKAQLSYNTYEKQEAINWMTQKAKDYCKGKLSIEQIRKEKYDMDLQKK